MLMLPSAGMMLSDALIYFALLSPVQVLLGAGDY